MTRPRLGEHAEVVAIQLRRRIGRIDVDATAAAIDVELLEHRFRGPVRGAAIAGQTVLLDDRLRGASRDWVFAHELGHVLVQRREVCVAGREEEWFADYFAGCLLLPKPWLDRDGVGPRLARRTGVGDWLVALRLAVHGRAPSLLQAGRSVLCATCGVRCHDPRCRCSLHRTGRQRRTLPNMRSLPGWQRTVPSQLQLTLPHVQDQMPAPTTRVGSVR